MSVKAPKGLGDFFYIVFLILLGGILVSLL